MEFKKNNTDNYQDKVNQDKKVIRSENVNYLYPNGHRITNQMRWFKGIRDLEIQSDIAA